MVFRFLRRPLLTCVTALALLLYAATPAWADFVLPPLPYAAEALEPAIDATTMTIHHDRHHGAYVANLNGLIASNPALAKVDLEALQGQISRFPVAVRNNAGGHWNHSQFWAGMAPVGQGGEPSADLLAAINGAFGSMESLQTQFNQAASGRFAAPGSSTAFSSGAVSWRSLMTPGAGDRPAGDLLHDAGDRLAAVDRPAHDLHRDVGDLPGAGVR